MFALETIEGDQDSPINKSGGKGRTKTKTKSRTKNSSAKRNTENDRKCDNNDNDNDENMKEKKETIDFDRTLIIDVVALGWGNGIHASNNIISFVNDCRKNIISTKLTLGDKQTQNTEFVAGSVNGWPSAFLVTTKNIKKGCDLWCYYGELYHNAIVERDIWLEKNEATKNWVIKTILKDDDYSRNDSYLESYSLE